MRQHLVVLFVSRFFVVFVCKVISDARMDWSPFLLCAVLCLALCGALDGSYVSCTFVIVSLMLSFVELVARSIETQTEVLLEIAVLWQWRRRRLTQRPISIGCINVLVCTHCSPAVIVRFGSFDARCKLRCDADERFSPTACGRISFFAFLFFFHWYQSLSSLCLTLRKGLQRLCVVTEN